MSCRTRLGFFRVCFTKGHSTGFIYCTSATTGAAAIGVGSGWVYHFPLRGNDVNGHSGTMVVGYAWVNVQEEGEIDESIGITQRTVDKVNLVIAFGKIKGHFRPFDCQLDLDPDGSIRDAPIPVAG